MKINDPQDLAAQNLAAQDLGAVYQDDPEETSQGGLSRRSFVKAAAVSLGALGFASLTGCSASTDNKSTDSSSSDLPTDNAGTTAHEVSSIAQAEGTEIEITSPSAEPKYEIIDSHLHYLDFLERTDGFPALVKAQDMSGVTSSVIFGMGIAKQWDASVTKAPSYYLSNDSRCYYYSGTDFILAEDLLAQPESTQKRFYPFCCGINGNDRFSAEHIRQLLRIYPNFWCGIGEIMSRHDDLTALTYGEPPHIDHPAFLEVFDLGAEEELPVLVHHNITAANTEEVLYLDELKTALAHNRKCKIIWAHVGISRRVEIQDLISIADQLLEENSNLWIDISWVVYDYYMQDKFPDGYLDGDSIQDWAALFEKWPDRFMVGTDKVGHWQTYPDEVVKYNELLDLLTEDTRRKLCHDNILSVIKTY